MRKAVSAVVAALSLVSPVATAQTVCMDAETREKARALMLEGIDAGLKQHTVHVFDNWLKDPSDQPTRANRGMKTGVSAYVRSRASALKWSPPPCKEATQ